MEKEIRILIVEDNINDYELTLRELKNLDFKFLPKLIKFKEEFIASLNEFNPDIIISDYMLPQFDGMTALKISKELKPGIPFIILIGSMNEETAVDCMKAGATDYVIKEHIARLIPPVLSAINKSKIQREKEEIEKAFRESETKFRTLTETTSSAIFINHEYIIYANKAAQELCGYSIEEILKMKYWELIHPDFLELAKTRDVSRHNEKEVPERYELKIIRKDKEERWLDITTGTIDYNGQKYVIVTAFDITKRKLDEAALRESEERFRSSFENAVIGKAIINTKGNFLKVNNSFCKMIDYSEYELCQMSFENITHPEDIDKSWEAGNLLISGKVNNVTFEKRYLRKDGSVIWVIISFIVHSKISDVPYSFTSEIIDMTERKKTERELRESEARFRTLTETTASAIFIFRNDNFLYINPYAEKMSGYSKKELLNMKFWDIVHPDFKEMIEQRGKARQLGALLPSRYEFKILTKDRKELWLDFTAGTIEYQGTQAVIGTAFDITEKKKSEEKIIQSEVQFRSVWENSFDALRLTDEDSVILEVNEAYCKLSGKQKKDLEGKTYDVVYSDSEHHLVSEFKRDFKARTIKLNYENEITYWDGRKIWAEISNSFIEIEGQPAKLLTIFRNITLRKEAEHELITAKEKAEEMSRLKSNFLANMSHELRTPMIGILGFSEILKEEIGNPEQKEMIESIHSGGARLMQTLNQLLDLSRIESNKLDIILTPVDLSGIVSKHIKSYEGAAIKKNLYLRQINIKENISAELDERIFIQIFNNLLNNALKFTKVGGITVEVDKEKDNDNVWAVLRVIDTGIGIPGESMEMIFEEFRQASEGLSRNYEGTGLGLTITKRSVELMKGTISVESKEGVGSTFTVRLPSSKEAFKQQ
ncbi:MAG: PAS domain-containing protein [Ignavibacteriaceae bacterium]